MEPNISLLHDLGVGSDLAPTTSTRAQEPGPQRPENPGTHHVRGKSGEMTHSQTTHQPARGSAGFGLIELLSAVTFSAVGVLAVASVSSTSARQGQFARQDANEAMAASRVLERARQSTVGTGSVLRTVRLGSRSIQVREISTAPVPGLTQVAANLAASPITFETRFAHARPVPVSP